MYPLLRYLAFVLFAFAMNGAYACSQQNCIEENSWQLGVAIGIGIRSNPLVDGDNIPLVILPDIAWYAKNSYFDNGELGYQWQVNNHYSFETFIRLDQQRALFSFYHPANILNPSQDVSSLQPLLPETPDESDEEFDRSGEEKLKYPSSQKISINNIAKRKWAINGGIRGHYYSESSEWQASIENDISNVHQGYVISLSYSHKWLLNKTQLKLQLGTDWKSEKLIDYYYGISDRDNSDDTTHYQGTASLEPYLSLHLLKPITQDWSLLANMSYKKLPSAMTSSPIVEESSIQRVFIGAAYRF
ncbi:MipA/OmpV family protein [Paraglaciecola aquimarina]|uniref:MipA/OmpV family protein n=1 Tax=Paraglaciecola aquimarina TaxID=1235557 RepID=A0ABU3SV37_9ALTE|nr:MipA/OmpV family protein [Paraglaciecola aquimarina]MDU0353890.1 MipA/OmpV family protein [Paraglaciecola aquimarina]